MYDERKYKSCARLVCDCDEYGYCPWDTDDGIDCYFWCGVEPDPDEPAGPPHVYARG